MQTDRCTAIPLNLHRSGAVVSQWCAEGHLSAPACADDPASPMTPAARTLEDASALRASAHRCRCFSFSPIPAGAVHFRQTRLDMVRARISGTGVVDPASQSGTDLRPALSLVSCRSHFKVQGRQHGQLRRHLDGAARHPYRDHPDRLRRRFPARAVRRGRRWCTALPTHRRSICMDQFMLDLIPMAAPTTRIVKWY